MNKDEILDRYCEFPDIDAYSIREYLERLLYTLWCEGEGFSGKRPFGRSGWEYCLYEALWSFGLAEGEYYEESGEFWGNTKEANHIVFQLIEHCFKKTKDN